MQKIKGSLKYALPWILLIIGLFCITFGTFHDFETDKLNKLFTTIGSSILASGIFAIILKTIQFMGVFKEELNSVIFETKFLKNRVDLPIFWEKVTKELVKDKFPNIHNAIMKDVKETYLPTSVVAYYDSGSNVIELSAIDVAKRFIKVRHKSSFTIIPNDQNEAFDHPYTNRLIKASNCSTTSCEITSIKVNGVVFTPKVTQKTDGNSLITQFRVPLKGDKNGYKMEIEVEKIYCLDYDNVIAFTNGYLMNGLKVQIFLNDNITAKFFDCGTLTSFKTIHAKNTLIEKVFSGIMYKGQGYIVYLEMK